MSKGGVTEAKPLAYSPPTGPTSQDRQGPGLGGANLGVCGTQGKHGVGVSDSGSPGLHGENRGMGTNRKG